MIRYVLYRPVAVSMCTLALLLLGAIATQRMPISLMPDLDIPELTVRIQQPGKTAEELDKTLVSPLRSALLQVTSVTQLTSETRDDAATLTLKLAYGADTDLALLEANEEVDRLMTELPRTYARPRVVKANASDIPVFFLDLTLAPQYDSEGQRLPTDPQAFLELSTFAREVIRRRLEQLPEIAFVDISGAQYPELFIAPYAGKMQALGVTPAMLRGALEAQTGTLGNLTVQEGPFQFRLQFSGAPQTKAQIEGIFIKVGERVVRLAEIAEVQERSRNQRGEVRAQGRQAITLAIIKQGQARLGDLETEIEALTGEFSEKYPSLQFELVRDQTQLLQASIQNLVQSLLWGAVIAILIVLVFLRDWRSSLLIAITLPTALGVSVLVFYLLGLSINIISLSGLVLGIGMMVDNGIIVVENIQQFRQEGRPLAEACWLGAKEVARPMLSAVLTTAAVFIPLIYLQGLAGALFYEEALSVVISTLVSLVVSILLIPVYYRILYQQRTNKSTAQPSAHAGWYTRGVRFALRKPWVVLAAVGLVLVSGLWSRQQLEVRQLPELTETETLLLLDWNEPINLEESRSRIGALLEANSQARRYASAWVGPQQFVMQGNDLTISQAMLYLQYTSPEALDSAKEAFRQKLERIPRASYRFEPVTNIFNQLFPPQAAPLEARIRPLNQRQATATATFSRVYDGLKEAYEGSIQSPIGTQPYWLLVFDLQKLATYGISYEQAILPLKEAFTVQEVYAITQGSSTVPIKMGAEAHNLDSLIRQSFIRVTDSLQLPLHAFVQKTQAMSFSTLYADEGGLYYPVLVNYANTPSQAMADVEEQVISAGEYAVDFHGAYFENQALVKDLTWVLSVSLLLLYFILAIQFESLTQPLLILLEVPITVFACLTILYLTGESLNLMSLIGIIVMGGIIINDSILKIDTINHLRKQGMALEEAIHQGGLRRLRPILMTSLTTILAMVPLLFGSGLGTELQQPLAVAIMGGLSVGTLASLFLLPTAYKWVYHFSRGKSTRP